MSSEYHIQPALITDIPDLVRHHRLMFEEIDTPPGKTFNEENLKKMEREYTIKLNEELRSGSCKAWIIKRGHVILASGAVSFTSLVPLPHDSSFKVAYLHSIFTEKEYRNSGMAKMIINTAIEVCQLENISRMFLHSSKNGRSVYEKMGFRSSNSTMDISF